MSPFTEVSHHPLSHAKTMTVAWSFDDNFGTEKILSCSVLIILTSYLNAAFMLYIFMTECMLKEYYLHQTLCSQTWHQSGRGNSTVFSVSVCQAGGPGSLPAQSTCFRKVEFYHCVIHSFPPVLTTGSKKAVHVLLCLCNNACKRSLAICRKSRALCSVSRLLSVPIWPACVKQGR